MVSNRSSGNGNSSPAIVGLVAGILLMVAAATIGFVWQWSSIASWTRQTAHQQSIQTQSSSDHRNQSEIRQILAAEVTADAAVWQLVFNSFGLLGLGATIYYANRAWLEAKRSADAAHKTLEDAQADSVAQAERFRRQLKLSEESVLELRRSTVEANRAWVVVSGEITSALTFDEEEVRIEANINIKNIGLGPAMKVILDWGMFGSPGMAHRKIRENTYNRSLSPVSHGGVLLPGDVQGDEVLLVMKRADFLKGCDDMAEIDKENAEARRASWPSIFFGVQYALPGDRNRRFSYMSYFITRNEEPGDFDGSIGSYELDEIALHDARDAGPVT